MLEDDIKKLDEIVKKMEAGDLGLEQALEHFSQGLELVKRCTKTLESAELKVREIVEKSAGTLEEKDL